MMSHNNQQLISPLYDSHPYAPEHNLIDPASLNIFDMAEGSYNPMLDRINPHGIVLPTVMPGFAPATPDGMSCTRKHRSVFMNFLNNINVANLKYKSCTCRSCNSVRVHIRLG